MPVGIKDIIETHDMPTQMGSPIYAGFQPRRDAGCVLALRRAGAVLPGKTVTTEFAAGRAGPTRNPFGLERTPGGSSSGSAAAVAAGILPVALGTQTMASIVRPSSYCGVFGWKPSHGTLSTDGIQPLSATLDHLGVLAADVEDAWSVAIVIAAATPGSALAGQAWPRATAPRRLVPLRTAGWPETDEASKAALATALRNLAAAGVDVASASDPRVAAMDRLVTDAADAAWRVFAWESQWPVRSYRARGDDMIGPRLHELLAMAAGIDTAAYRELLRTRAALRDAAASFGPDAAFVSLSSSGPAPPGLENTGSRLFGCAWTLLGGPSVSLPVLRSGGLPLGLQLMGAPATDSALIAAARWMLGVLAH